MKAIYIGYLAGAVWIIIPLVYQLTAPDWPKTRVGRSFMWLAASTAGLFLLLITGGIFGEYPGREWVRAGVYLAVLFAGVQIIALFVRLRREGDRALRAAEAKAQEEASK